MTQQSLLVVILLSILVFTGLAVYGDLPELINNVARLPAASWAAALGLTVVHLLIRLVRWEYYLRVLGISVSSRTSCLVFLSGLSMVMVPGRVGELSKAYFLKQKEAVPISLSAPVVLMERITDVIAVSLLGAWWLRAVPFGWVAITIIMVSLGLFFALLASPKGMALLLRTPVLRKWEPFLTDASQSLRVLASLKVMGVGLLLGCLAWLALGITFWIVLQGTGAGLSALTAVAIFSTSTLLGSITMLPGGLVTTEGSLLVLLQQVGLDGAMASAAVLIARVCTLWFAVLIGLTALLYLQRNQPKVPAHEASSYPIASGSPES